MKLSIPLLLIAAIIPSLAISSAFAAQPYVASYPDFAKVESSQAFMYNNFAGTTTSGLDSWVASLISSAGRTSTGTPSGYIFQMASMVKTDGNLQGLAQVWNGATKTFDCATDWANGCPTFGALSSNNHFYQTYYWDGAKTKVTYYWEAWPNSGSVNIKTGDYTRPSADTSRNFLAGTDTVSSKKYKFLQAGVESAAVSDSWQVYEYDGGFVQIGTGGGTKYLRDYNGYHTTYKTSDSTNHSYITYSGTTSYSVGAELYTANADYELKSGSSMLGGNVKWYYDLSLPITVGRQLWNP
ncbi:MAG: hypothetical protein HZA84_00850 [Thaumarchaeota archaeon]|nr:hypothetical protein [Nitrososphaerota archaeon]